jgi:hypothetical protein
VFLGLWEPDGDDKYKKLEKTIEDLKVKLFQTILAAPAEHDSVRKTLNRCKLNQNKMYRARHCLDRLTYEGWAEIVAQRYVYGRTIYTEDGELLWQKEKDVCAPLLERIIIAHKQTELDTSRFREVARSEPWRSMWTVHKAALSANVHIPESARTLMLFSRMYDNAFEHPDCPKDEVIEDDDMFDGWLITQRREREKDQMDKQLEKQKAKVFGKDRRTENASEFFLPAASAEEAKRIHDHNSLEGKMIRKQRDARIKNAGDQHVAELDLPDVRRDLTMQANKQFVDTVKGRK